MTTLHLGDCLNGCATCAENSHADLSGEACGTCGLFIESNETTTCNLCGAEIQDLFTAGVVLPWGTTCRTCLDEIYGKESK